MLESWRKLTDFWFLHAYVFMMMLAPVIDMAINHALAQEGKSVRTKILLSWLLPLVLLCFGWSYANAIMNDHPRILSLLPKTSGLGAYTGLTLTGVYAVGRVFRMFRDDVKLPRWILIGLVFISLIAASIKLAPYNSPFAIVLAIVTFVLVERIRLSESIGRAVCFLAPSMFSVYLLQTNRFFIPKFALLSQHLIILPTPIKYFVVACVVFVVCVAVDMLRRIIVSMVRKMV